MPEKLADKLWSWASILEDQARDQAIATSTLPFIHPHVALMPDAHWGMGSTVGSVIATRGAVMPACVGVDIGCGMSATRTDLLKADIEFVEPLSTLRRSIEAEVPVSKGNYRKELSPTAEERVIQLRDRAVSQGVDPYSYAPNWPYQLGTLGSGNHFIELCYDEEDRVWVFLHSGSRGVGNKIAQKHVKIAQALCAKFFVELPHKDLAYLPHGTDEFWAYLKDLTLGSGFRCREPCGDGGSGRGVSEPLVWRGCGARRDHHLSPQLHRGRDPLRSKGVADPQGRDQCRGRPTRSDSWLDGDRVLRRHGQGQSAQLQ